MKWIIGFLIFFQTYHVFAAENKTKATRATASADCVTYLTQTVVESEAKEVQIGEKMIKVTQVKLLGNGAGLVLYSVFVDSSKTPDNTHWEIVGEINLSDGSCKPVFSKRFEAP